MRASSVCLCCVALSLGACKPEPEPEVSAASSGPRPASAKDPDPAGAEAPATPREGIGARASEPCRVAMKTLSDLDDYRRGEDQFDAAMITKLVNHEQGGASTLEWLDGADRRLGRVTRDRADDVALLEGVLAGLASRDQDGLRYDLAMIVTQLRAVALLELRRLLGELADGRVSGAEARTTLDETYCLWDGGLRELARRADALPTRGGEGWEASIDEALRAAAEALDDPAQVKATKQQVEKGLYAVAYRLILAQAEAQTRAGASEALGLLDAIEDRLVDRNGPGLKRMRRAFNGDPTKVDAALVERELAVAFAKRARKYCDKAINGDELATPTTIAETWEGVIYTRVILPSMAEALSAEGFDGDAYLTDWEDYLAAVEAGDRAAASAISPRLIEWNCAYQDRLGIAECSASSNEVE